MPGGGLSLPAVIGRPQSQAAEPPTKSQPASRCAALTVLATVRIRRGETGATELLEEARRLAEQIDELQRIGPVAAARCEQATCRVTRQRSSRSPNL
jgi:hypothetical protein